MDNIYALNEVVQVTRRLSEDKDVKKTYNMVWRDGF